MPPRRLSEQDMAQLYMQTEAPLRLDALLQGQEDAETGQIAVHDSIRAQTPDLGLISLSLCALIIVRDWPEKSRAEMLPVLQELRIASEDNLITVGRLWLDSAVYGIAPDPKTDKDTILSIPDRLRILTSIFQELRDALEEDDAFRQGLNTLYYQSESHSDLADRYVENLSKPTKKPALKEKAARGLPNQIPLPFELTRKQDQGTVVAFSLFKKR